MISLGRRKDNRQRIMRCFGLTLGRKLKEAQALRSIVLDIGHAMNATQVLVVRAIRDEPELAWDHLITAMDMVDFTIFDEVANWRPRPMPIDPGIPLYRIVPAEPDPKRKHWHRPNPKSPRKGVKGQGGLINGRGRFRG